MSLLLNDKILKRFDSILLRINKSRKESKELEGKYPLISNIDLLLTKFICEILIKFMNIFKKVEI